MMDKRVGCLTDEAKVREEIIAEMKHFLPDRIRLETVLSGEENSPEVSYVDRICSISYRNRRYCKLYCDNR